MPRFRPTIPMDELRDRLTPEQRAAARTDYQASRGGWFRQPEKPVPGTPKRPRQ